MRIPTTILALLLGALPVSAQAEILTAKNDRVRARSISIQRQSGALVLQYTDEKGRRKMIDCSDVVEIFLSKTRPPKSHLPGSILAITTSGDRIFGTIAGPTKEEDGVRLDSGAYGEIEIPFEHLSSLRFLANRQYWPRDLPERNGRNDLLVTKSNDHAEGTINLIQKNQVAYYSKRLRSDKKIAFPDVSMIFFMDPSDVPPRPPESLYSIVTTNDGSIKKGILRSLKKGVLEFEDLRGKRMSLSASKLSALHFRNGRVIYLSDLSPSEVEENPNYIRPADGKPLPSDLSYPWKADRSAAGTPIMIGGKEFRKGIGVRAYSSLTFDLPPIFKRFQASAGVDDVLQGGDVQIEVWVDGKNAFSERVRAGENPLTIDLDVTGARRLRLVVDFGQNANIGDFADWGAARLIK